MADLLPAFLAQSVDIYFEQSLTLALRGCLLRGHSIHVVSQLGGGNCGATSDYKTTISQDSLLEEKLL